MRASRSSMMSLHQLSRAVAALTLVSGLAGLSPAALAQSAPAAAAAPSAEAAEIQRLIKSGQSTQALKLIDDALAKNPKDPAMRFRRGVTLSMLDRKAEALQVFQKLVEDHPEMPAPYNNLAVLYGSQGDYDKARAALVAAIRTNPQYATAYQNLGDVYAQLASQAYSKALQLDKSDATVPPKLTLLRELITPGQAAPTTVAAATPVAPPTAVAMMPPVPKPVTPPAPVAPPKPAAPPPPAPTPVPPPAPKPAPAVAAGSTEVEAAVRAWAESWSRRDMNGYLGAYTPDFSAGGKSHKAWEEDRRVRIVPKKHISVGISDLRVTVNGDRAEARFRQNYESDALSTSSRKTLELVRSASGKWLIKQESVGG